MELDGGALGGETWHTELLRQMSLDVPDVRPPVLQAETAARLDEYRKFRHRIRNIYATNLDPIGWLPGYQSPTCGWRSTGIAAFAMFLSDLAEADAGAITDTGTLHEIAVHHKIC